MARRKRRKFSDEFKHEAVRLCSEANRSIGDVARELDLTESALRMWVKQHEVDQGKGPPGALTTEEREELQRLREEKVILKKASATFFVKESE
ncbi:MAG: transposase [Myxococcales bacterium]|nr:transposase [Deltaproteobacteria bacterium]MBT8480911.1 transposase [Deltaproteobacteria bacterium]NND28859.1 transposase [Myxococcales bacterium]NNL23778.1 transposase [Myxococcales bacterium]